jgi:hypothetical protein
MRGLTYEKFGFVFADPSGVPREGEQFRTMFFDLKPLLDALDAQENATD